MLDFLIQGFGLVLLGSVMLAAWWRYVHPLAGQLSLPAHGLLLVVVTTLAGAIVGSPFWWLGEPRAFSWRLPPLAGRMLAAAAWAFIAATVIPLRQPTRRRLRLCLLLLATYLAPLVAVILGCHLDRFDFFAPITYAFFAIAGGLSVAALGFLLRTPDVLPDPPPLWPRLPTQVWYAGVAAVALAWAAALFVTDRGPLPFVWVWPGDLLTSRLIASMLLTLGVGAACAVRHRELARMMLVIDATYGLGVIAASLWGRFAGKPVPVAYLAAFSLLFLGSSVLLRLERPGPAEAPATVA